MQLIKWFDDIGLKDIAQVGGKNASLGEMTVELKQLGINVPFGFATTASAYLQFLSDNNLKDKINQKLQQLDINNLDQLYETGRTIRGWILDSPFSPQLERAIHDAWEQLCVNPEQPVAVRSSATAEDLADASFAGQQESFLNITGYQPLLDAIKKVYASLFNDRAITYRVHNNFEHEDIAISVGVQQMVRSDLASSGVMFTVDTETGFDQVVFITSAYGLGEAVVQGSVNPDEFYVDKRALDRDHHPILKKNVGSKAKKMVYSDEPGENIKYENVAQEHCHQLSLSDAEVIQLARYAQTIEKHYQKPMDVEWGKDGLTGELMILQARPETVTSRQQVQKTYNLVGQGQVKATGRSVGQGIGSGRACCIKSIQDMGEMETGQVLVTDMTDPDWEPIMSKASAIVTNRGGRTCHAAIIAREIGIPAVVGCSDATDHIKHGEPITVSCAEGETGYIYEGELEFNVQEKAINELPDLPVQLMLNIGNPDRAFELQSLPNSGVGLARLEFIINNIIGIHPKALLELDQIAQSDLRQTIENRIACYASPKEFYIEKLREGIATIAAAFYPKPVIFRLSDFKSNEYANLLGGDAYEPQEENPMLGFRGACRYTSPIFSECFAMECEALKRAREDNGLDNIQIMVPFVRTLHEAEQVIQVLADNQLKRGVNGLKIMMMCEIPSNALLAEQFLEYFDGFSIGSNDMTQLALGTDRDSAFFGTSFDERDPAVKRLLSMAIEACRSQNKYIGICGQAPSDYPELAEWLVEQGIDSLSLNPDSVLTTAHFLAHSCKTTH